MKTQTFFKTTRRITSIAFILLVMVSCSNDDDSSTTVEPTNAIYDFIQVNYPDSNFLDAINMTGFENEINDMSTEFTLLMPSNNAFSEYYDTTIFESEEARNEALRTILRRHFIDNQVILFDDAIEGAHSENLNGDDLYFYTEGAFMVIDASESFSTYATQTDILTDNGVIHLVADIITTE